MNDLCKIENTLAAGEMKPDTWERFVQDVFVNDIRGFNPADKGTDWGRDGDISVEGEDVPRRVLITSSTTLDGVRQNMHENLASLREHEVAVKRIVLANPALLSTKDRSSLVASAQKKGIPTKRMQDMQDIPEASSDSQKQTTRSRLGNALSRSIQMFLTVLQTSRVDVVALLIDGENISPDMIAHVLIEAGKFGGVTIRRVYGNIISPNMQRWKEVMLHYALQGMHQTPIIPGKNAADIALTVDAMDLFYREQVTRFCLVASDSDYTPLVLRLRAAGCLVIGIGEPKTPPPLVKACTVFVFTDQLGPFSSKVKSSTVSSSSEASAPSVQKAKAKQTILLSTDRAQGTKDLSALLKRAYNEATKGKETEGVLVSRLGLALRQIDPTFKATTYGQKDLSSLLKQHEDIFEIQKRSAKGGHLEVRLRRPTH